MKKSFCRQIFCCVLVVAMIIAFLPTSAQAETYKYTYKSSGTMTAGTYKSLKDPVRKWSGDDYSCTYYCYKISIPENGYIKLTCSEATIGEFFILPVLSKCSTKKSAYDNSLYNLGRSDKGSSRTNYFALNKGTYYLCCFSNYSSSVNAKFKYNFYKATAPTNYCRAKAQSLAASKTKTICFNKGYEYSRWYKITLSTKKTITVTYKKFDSDNSYSGQFQIYNSAGERVNCPQLDGNVYRTAKQPKGTYYICVSSDIGYTDKYDRIRSISWK